MLGLGALDVQELQLCLIFSTIRHALDLWKSKQRGHNAKRPAIETALADALQKNNSASYASLEAKIDYWCSAGTIRRWVTSRDGYRVYKERIIPLLSDEQKTKRFDFVRNFRNNCGLGGGNYLLIHYGEKWFWGMVTKSTARTFDGLDQQTQQAYHK